MQKKPIISRIIEGAKNCDPDPIISGYLEQKNKHNEMIVSSLSQPLVTVIMPVYNGARYVSEAIESILFQTYQTFELIIVNDGSNDDSKAVITPYLKDLRIRYFEQCNAGVAAARNAAIKESQGEFIGFLDQDDYWHINKLKIQVEYLKTHQDTSLVYSDYEILNEANNEIENVSKIVDFDLSECDFVPLFSKNRIGALTVLTYKRCILSSGQFDENLKGTDDYELWLKIALQYKLVYQPVALATYRLHETNASRNVLKMLIFEAMALSNIIKNYRLSARLLGRKTIKNRLYPLYKKIGDLVVMVNKDRKSARSFYFKAFRYNPFDFDLACKILSTYIPPYTLRYITWQYRKVLNILANTKNHAR